MWKGALFQLSSTDDPKENLETINEMINMAAAKNVDFIALPETRKLLFRTVNTSRQSTTSRGRKILPWQV